MDYGNDRFIFLHKHDLDKRFSYEDIHNDRTINIFSDASMMGSGGEHKYGCFGSIVVYKDDIVDKFYRLASNCTTNECELAGLRLSLSYALSKAHLVDNINIFSDSLYSVDSIRKYIYKYKFRRSSNINIPIGELYKSTDGNSISNQSLIIECIDLYIRCKSINPNIHIYHQSGHVCIDRYDDVVRAANIFANLNHISLPLDLNIIRYISYYNNYIDKSTRAELNRYCNKGGVTYTYPVEFYPMHKYYKERKGNI